MLKGLKFPSNPAQNKMFKVNGNLLVNVDNKFKVNNKAFTAYLVYYI